jgi:transposase
MLVAVVMPSVWHAAITPSNPPLNGYHESTVADELLEAARGKALIGDTGYDANAFIEAVQAKGMKPVIHANPTRQWHLLKLDRSLYRKRYLIEVFFHKLKCFRAIATRYDKTARSYLGLVHLVCAFLSLN